jgi:hypothetical protein
MHIEPIIRSDRKAQWKVEEVMARADCSRDTAVAYLEAEEWIVDDALFSLMADRSEAAYEESVQRNYEARGLGHIY